MILVLDRNSRIHQSNKCFDLLGTEILVCYNDLIKAYGLTICSQISTALQALRTVAKDNIKERHVFCYRPDFRRKAIQATY